MTEEYFKTKIRSIPDFPKKGIMYRDITTLTSDSEAFAMAIDVIFDRSHDLGITKVVAIESRGFVFGSALAYKLGCGMVLVRKPGKLPFEIVSEDYTLEYGTDRIEIHSDALTPKDRVMIVDDLVATGGTLLACCHLVEKLGAGIACVATVVELSHLGGQNRFSDYNYFSLVKYDSG
ncbi:MAG: adenine phosphoribosyltransferase [Candidatus Zixiibacteriota bacterium]